LHPDTSGLKAKEMERIEWLDVVLALRGYREYPFDGCNQKLIVALQKFPQYLQLEVVPPLTDGVPD